MNAHILDLPQTRILRKYTELAQRDPHRARVVEAVLDYALKNAPPLPRPAEFTRPHDAAIGRVTS
jgi:hypothetical protein